MLKLIKLSFIMPFNLSFSFAMAAEGNFSLSSNEPITPISIYGDDSGEGQAKIILGRQLFEDNRLSRDQTISCASCHNLHHGGVDGKARSTGINGALGDINTPTVFNSGFNFRQFWNGRAKSLEEQIDGPIQHSKEMGAKWEDVVAVLKRDKQYLSMFSLSYKDGITKENIKNAIASFERSLVTPNSRFDQFLNGNKDAISALEKTGYQRFKSFGCIACHQGMNVGGNMYQTMGVMGDYFKDRGLPIIDADLGRYSITKETLDKYVFRVPSLRNVELTAPYFHDAYAKTLEQAVSVMAKYQLGRMLSKEDIDSIVAFLKTLTGEPPKILSQTQKANSK